MVVTPLGCLKRTGAMIGGMARNGELGRSRTGREWKVKEAARHRNIPISESSVMVTSIEGPLGQADGPIPCISADHPY